MPMNMNHFAKLRTGLMLLLGLATVSTAAAQQPQANRRQANRFFVYQARQDRDNQESDRPQLESADSMDSDLADYQPSNSDQVSENKIPQWPAKSMSEIDIDIRDDAQRTPADRSFELAGYGRQGSLQASPKVYAWAAPNIRYQPLYFEDVALERYGQTLSPFKQSVVSNLHFWKSLVLLPHQMINDRPASCEYPLGFCRPGDQHVPFTVERQLLVK